MWARAVDNEPRPPIRVNSCSALLCHSGGTEPFEDGGGGSQGATTGRGATMGLRITGSVLSTGLGATSSALEGGGLAFTISTVMGPLSTIVIASSIRLRSGIEMSTRCTNSEMQTQRMKRREYGATAASSRAPTGDEG